MAGLTKPDSPFNWARCLKGSTEVLVPGLGSRDADDLVLAVAHVEVELGEEFLLGKGIGGVDAEVGLAPGRAHTRPAAHFDAAADSQAVDDPREAAGR